MFQVADVARLTKVHIWQFVVAEIYLFDVAGFVPISRRNEDGRLIHTEIAIIPGYGDGPRPRACRPQGYIAARESAGTAGC